VSLKQCRRDIRFSKDRYSWNEDSMAPCEKWKKLQPPAEERKTGAGKNMVRATAGKRKKSQKAKVQRGTPLDARKTPKAWRERGELEEGTRPSRAEKKTQKDFMQKSAAQAGNAPC